MMMSVNGSVAFLAKKVHERRLCHHSIRGTKESLAPNSLSHMLTHLKVLDLRLSAVLLGSNSQYLRSSKILSRTGFNVSERYGIPII